jgi:F-type H+-transporting ATPase subunit b
MPQLNLADFSPQIIWLVITFAALYLVMWKIALPHIGDVLQERQERITDDREKAASLRDEADEAIEAYEGALAQARAQAQNSTQAARAELGAAADVQRGEVEAKLAAQAGEAEHRISAARAEALGHIRAIAADAAKSVMHRLIGVEASDAALQSAVKAAIGGDPEGAK